MGKTALKPEVNAALNRLKKAHNAIHGKKSETTLLVFSCLFTADGYSIVSLNHRLNVLPLIVSLLLHEIRPFVGSRYDDMLEELIKDLVKEFKQGSA